MAFVITSMLTSCQYELKRHIDTVIPLVGVLVAMGGLVAVLALGVVSA